MKNLLKGTCLVVALMATFAMVGCGGGGGSSKKSSAPVTNVAVNIPLPAPAANMRANVRASISTDTFKAYYYNADALVEPYNYLSDDASATVIFAMVPTIDLVVKSELNKGDGFKPYYQGLISKAKINGSNIKQKLTPETTAKAMLFEAKAENDTNLSIENFEYTMEQEEAKGNDVWTMLGVTSADMEKSLTDLTVEEDVESKAKTAADSLEIEEKPAPQPTPTTGYVDELNQKLVENTTWKTSDERTIYQLLTTGRSEPGEMNVYDEEKDVWVWVNVDPIADGGMAAEIIYSTKDGANWTAPTDKPIIIYYEEMGGSHPYCLYRNNKWVGPAQQFHYKKATKLFRYVYYNHEKSLKEPVEKGLENYELLDSRYFKVEEVTLDKVTYYRATNNDNAKDIYLFKLIKRPADLGKVNPSDEVIEVDKLMTATWEPATEEGIQELIGYNYVRSARVIYSFNGTKWETPTDVFLTYAVIPNAFHPWHVYVNGVHVDSASIQVYDDVWSINNLVVSENKTIAGSYKFLTTKIDGVSYLQMKNTESDDIMTSMFMKVDRLPVDIEEDINEMINNSSASGNVRR